MQERRMVYLWFGRRYPYRTWELSPRLLIPTASFVLRRRWTATTIRGYLAAEVYLVQTQTRRADRLVSRRVSSLCCQMLSRPKPFSGPPCVGGERKLFGRRNGVGNFAGNSFWLPTRCGYCALALRAGSDPFQ